MLKYLNRFFHLLPLPLRALLPVYLWGMLIFLVFRITLLIASFEQLYEIKRVYGRVLYTWWSFQKGFRFDTVISCYLLALPALIYVVMYVGKIRFSHALRSTLLWFTGILFSLSFFACAADIPFFLYNFSRLTAVIFSWMNNIDFGIQMIAQEPSYYLYFFLFLAVTVFYLLQIKKHFSKLTPDYFQQTTTPLWQRTGISLLFLFLVFLGIRGRTQAPIRIENAFTTNFAFTNQLGLNPVFTLLVSYLDKTELMDVKQAEQLVRAYYKTEQNGYASPVARNVIAAQAPLKKNIVLVLMESMSAEKMGRFGNTLNLTPALDSLANISWSFDRIYSAGKHTFNGIYSTLFSYPAFLREHPMSNIKINTYSGLPWVLKQNGYYNIYFTTHFETFDNAGGFLLHNHFDRIVSQKDYPKDKIHNIFGVPDHYLFEYAIPQLNLLSKNEQPFFATLLTTSDHGPYMVPDNIPFRPREGDIKQQVIEYADWSIKHFMELAAGQSWYNNTIFVFVADHGGIVGNNVYDMPLSYHHSPFLIHSPDTAVIQPRSFGAVGGQIDVFPTLMGLMGFSYVNNTFGIDLLRESRPYITFSADDKIGCLDSSRFFVWRQQGEETLYDYVQQNPANLALSEKEKAAAMKSYAFSLVQCAKWMSEQEMTAPIPLK